MTASLINLVPQFPHNILANLFTLITFQQCYIPLIWTRIPIDTVANTTPVIVAVVIPVIRKQCVPASLTPITSE